jgi:hypothetical protein
MFRVVLVILIVAAAIAAKVPFEAQDAHRRADAVLYPQFVATLNKWALAHGPLDDPAHLGKFDAQDAKRWRATCDAWKELSEAMKAAGY